MESIYNAIKTILNTVDEIEQVLEFATPTPTGYPYAWIEYRGDESEIINNTQDKVTYEFAIHLIQEKFEEFKGRAEAEETTRDRSYTINQAFRADNDLGVSTVLRVRPSNTEKQYVDGASRIELIITLFVETVETITR